MNDLRKNQGLAQDIYTTTITGRTMFVSRDYFGDGAGYWAALNPTTNEVAVQKMVNGKSAEMRNLGNIEAITVETIEAALNDLDGVPPLTVLSATMFVDANTGVLQKTYDTESAPVMMVRHPGTGEITLRKLEDGGVTECSVPAPFDQPAFLSALSDLFDEFSPF